MNRSVVRNVKVNHENGFLDCRERWQSHPRQTSYAVGMRSVRGVSVTDFNSKSSYLTSQAGNGAGTSWKNTTYGAIQHMPSAPARYDEEETFLCHGNHSEPCADSNTNLMGLLLALTVHAILEGLAIGLQKVTSEVCNGKRFV